MPCRLPLLYRLVVSLSKKLDLSLFPQILLPVSSAGEKTIPPPPGGASTAAGEKPQQRAKTQTPRQARRKRYCFGSLIPTTPFCHNKTGEIPFCNNIFSFSQTIAIKTSLSPPSAGKTSGPPKKKSQSHCRDWLFPMAPPTRFERMAFRLGGGRSIHLSYGGTDIFILSYDNWFVNLLWTWPNGT